MILRIMCILGLLLLMAGAYLALIVLFFLTNPDEAMRELKDPVPEDRTKQRDGATLGSTASLTQRVVWYIRNGIEQ